MDAPFVVAHPSNPEEIDARVRSVDATKLCTRGFAKRHWEERTLTLLPRPRRIGPGLIGSTANLASPEFVAI